MVGMGSDKVYMDQIMELEIFLAEGVTGLVQGENMQMDIALELFTHLPQEEFVYFWAPNALVREIYPYTPLDWLAMDGTTVDASPFAVPWNPNSCFTSDRPLKMLKSSYSGHICSVMVDRIKQVFPGFGVARDLNLPDKCPFGVC